MRKQQIRADSCCFMSLFEWRPKSSSFHRKMAQSSKAGQPLGPFFLGSHFQSWPLSSILPTRMSTLSQAPVLGLPITSISTLFLGHPLEPLSSSPHLFGWRLAKSTSQALAKLCLYANDKGPEAASPLGLALRCPLGSANFSYNDPDSRHSGFAGHIVSVTATLLLYKNGRRGYVNEWTWLCSDQPLFVDLKFTFYTVLLYHEIFFSNCFSIIKCVGVLLWHSGLRIWSFHCSDLGCHCAT